MDEDLDSLTQRYALRRNIVRDRFFNERIFRIAHISRVTFNGRSQRQRLQLFAADTPKAFASRQPLQLIRCKHEPFNRLAFNESIHNLRDVGDRDAPVKKVIGFD
jgi:hypothetical protein